MIENELGKKAFLQNANDYTERSFISATEVLPHVLELIPAKSIVDLGCGSAAWLSACTTLGVEDILGIDGDYVDLEKIKIPRNRFRMQDLRQPFSIDRKFDLAISLEVAEHIPKESSDIFVDSLTRLAPVILFSAAIPFQGGAGHVNEQWPSYWEEKFRSRGYQLVDCIRNRIWNNNKILPWYKQNIMLYIDAEHLKTLAPLLQETNSSKLTPIDIVHPENYIRTANSAIDDIRMIPFSTAWSALKFQSKKRIRSKIHWRLRKVLGM